MTGDDVDDDGDGVTADDDFDGTDLDDLDTDRGVLQVSPGDGGASARDAGAPGAVVMDAGRRPATSTPSGPLVCGDQAFEIQPIIPDMLIVLDRSSSMRSAGLPIPIRPGGQLPVAVDRWAPSVSAIKTLTRDFDARIAFGLMVFPAEGGQLCTPGDIRVPVRLGSASMIGTTLDAMQPNGGTPTGETLQRALTSFQGTAAPPAGRAPSPRYIVLVTDGQPTCPNAGGSTLQPGLLEQDKRQTLTALDALQSAGIKTFVIGYDAQLDPALAAALGEFAQHGGTERYYPVQDEASLSRAFGAITSRVVTCSFELEQAVADPRYLSVTLDGQVLGLNDPDGFSAEGRSVTVHGKACMTLQENKPHKIEVRMECVAQ